MEELSELVGMQLNTEEEITDAIRELEPYKIPVIAVSMGEKGSIVKMQDRMYRVSPPKVNVFNTIGCGDCFLAGLVYGIEMNFDQEQILRFATAVSASTAESPLSFGFEMERAMQLLPLIRIKEL